MAEEGSNKSKFNAGVALAERIDAMQKAINMSRFNLTAFNPDTGTRNYQVILCSIDSLKSECSSKATPTEKDMMNKLSLIAHTIMSDSDLSPIQIHYIDDQPEEIIIQPNLDRIKRILDYYEDNVKLVLEAHDLNSPNKQEEDDNEL